MIDTHCHIDAPEFDPDRDAVIARALQAGLTCIIVPAVTVDNFSIVREVCAHHPQCFPALGLHPIYAMQHQEADLLTLATAVKHQPVVAIGEIGLDAWDKSVDLERQKHFFAAQLKLARDMDLPVLLHARHAVDEVTGMLRRFGVRRGIVHAFNGSRQQADKLINMGFKLGFGGAMTYPRALNLRRLAAQLPLESLVLETDAPDMSPVWAHGQRNLPEYLPRIAEEIAALREITPESLMTACDANTAAVFAQKHGTTFPSPSPLREEGRGEGKTHKTTRTKSEQLAILGTFAKQMRLAPTEAEARLWYFLRNRRLNNWKFRRQHSIDKYIIDFICIDARLVIELDGGQHTDVITQQNDVARTVFLEKRGLRVLRFWNDEVLQQTGVVLERILKALVTETPHPNPLPEGERE
uniref:Putative deoxyribonuclease (TatD family) (Modular protein) n=1 Tax=mine drainage metagenome TaxID=410659 RepID=E6QR36_9ZZZZ